MVLGFCVWQGYRKGLILTVAGILLLCLAVWGASHISGRYAADFEERINPLFGLVVDEAADDAMRAAGYSAGVDDEDTILTIAAGAFSSMGIVEKESEKMAVEVLENMRESSVSLKTGISNAFIHIICRVLLFTFTFAVFALLFTLLSHFVSMLIKLPGLKLIDTWGGLAAGLVYGLLLLFAIGWIFRFLGAVIPSHLAENTFLLRFFVNQNILTAFL